MNWIEIENIDKHDVEGENILIWQENITDKECSRFQRAVYTKGDSKECSFLQIYPNTFSQYFMEDKDWIGSDLEGDKCQITHFTIVERP